MLMGCRPCGLGSRLDLLLAGLFEVPRLLTIQTSEDAAHYTASAGADDRAGVVDAAGSPQHSATSQVVAGAAVAAMVLPFRHSL